MYLSLVHICIYLPQSCFEEDNNNPTEETTGIIVK